MQIKKHTYNMGIIGNCSYLAYVDTKANIKWMCLPKFDSSFIFGSLLDEKKGGEFSIQPVENKYTSNQYYLKNTNILVTEFYSSDGSYRVIDFAPRFYHFDRYFKPLMVIRKLEVISGNPFIRVVCRPVGNYGEIIPQTVQGSNHIQYQNLDSLVRLTTDISLNYILDKKGFLLNDTKYLVFTYGVPLEAPLVSTAETFLDKTKLYWYNWAKATKIPNIFQEEVIRSALVLKLHQYEDTGGIIAAGTTSLPEHNQSGRTWDYRYCWMRDTYYTLNAFNNIGQFQELERYFNFIQNIILNEKEFVNPLYTITGNRVNVVNNLNLKGYLNNKPVRIGNDAVKQIQNDVYGQIMISLLPLFIDKRSNYADNNKALQITKWLLKQIEKTIELPDAGLWEFGNTIQHHSNTALFHWAGSKAGLKIAKYFNNRELMNLSNRLILKAKDKIEQCYDFKQKAYTQSNKNNFLDASSLQLITMNYLDPKSDISLNHINAIKKKLQNKDGLFFRYANNDDIGRPKVSFLICAFWYAEALACIGKVDEAFLMINKLNKYSNHLGLFSEDADMNGGQWGNFPQTYSHVGFINAVSRIANKQDNPIFF